MVILARGCESEALLEAGKANRRILVEKRAGPGRHLVLAGDGVRHRVLLTRFVAPWPGCCLVPEDDTLALRLAALTALRGERNSPQTLASHTALKPTTYQAHRLRLLLAILDQLDCTNPSPPTIRDIALDVIFPGSTADRAIEWKTSSRRRQAQRLVAEARRMRDSGFRDLLRGARADTPSGPRPHLQD